MLGACYRLPEEYRFPVLCLTEEELIGQATAAALSSASGLDINPGADPTVRKLRATGRGSTRKILEEAQRLVAVLDLKLADHSNRREPIRAIQRALIERRCLSGEYRSPYQDEAKALILHPYRLCLVKQAWYLIARPEGSDHPVTYRVARFAKLEVLEPPALIPEEFDLRAYFGNAWAVYRGEPTSDVVVRFTKEASAIVTETTWHRTQRVHHNEDGSVTLSFQVDGLEEITHWLVGWAGFVQVLRPGELRERVSERWRRGIAVNDAV